MPSDNWDSLFAFVKRRLGEIGVSDEHTIKIIEGLRGRFYGNYNYYDNFESCKQHINLLLNNLDPNSHLKSRRLLDALNDGTMDPSRLAHLGRMEMQPDRWKKELNEIEKRSNITVEIIWTNQYLCEICGKREQKVDLEQTRSIDEGQTLIITCKCGHKWYIYN